MDQVNGLNGSRGVCNTSHPSFTTSPHQAVTNSNELFLSSAAVALQEEKMIVILLHPYCKYVSGGVLQKERANPAVWNGIELVVMRDVWQSWGWHQSFDHRTDMQILKALHSPVPQIWRHLSQSSRVLLAGAVSLKQFEVIPETQSRRRCVWKPWKLVEEGQLLFVEREIKETELWQQFLKND